MQGHYTSPMNLWQEAKWYGAAAAVAVVPLIAVGMAPWVAPGSAPDADEAVEAATAEPMARDDRAIDIEPLIAKYAPQQRLDPALVRAVIMAESSGRPHAISNKEAKGLMQIMDGTHKDVLQRTGWTRGDIFNPDYNVKIGTYYLRHPRGPLRQRPDADGGGLPHGAGQPDRAAEGPPRPQLP